MNHQGLAKKGGKILPFILFVMCSSPPSLYLCESPFLMCVPLNMSYLKYVYPPPPPMHTNPLWITKGKDQYWVWGEAQIHEFIIICIMYIYKFQAQTRRKRVELVFLRQLTLFLLSTADPTYLKDYTWIPIGNEFVKSYTNFAFLKVRLKHS